jgi:hypothetical protein
MTTTLHSQSRKKWQQKVHGLGSQLRNYSDIDHIYIYAGIPIMV